MPNLLPDLESVQLAALGHGWRHDERQRSSDAAIRGRAGPALAEVALDVRRFRELAVVVEHQIDRAVRRDAVQPRAEIGARLEPAELSIRAEKAFLDHIFGILLIAGHPERQPENTPAVPLDERAKRLAVALAGTGQDGCSLA